MAEDYNWDFDSEDEGDEIPVEFVDDSKKAEEENTAEEMSETNAEDASEESAEDSCDPDQDDSEKQEEAENLEDEKKDDGQTVADEEDTDVSSEEDTEEAAAEGESEASDTEESEAADAEGSENTDAEDAEASVEETQTAPDTEEHKKTSFFGRKKNKEKEKLEQQIEDLTDKLRRSLAEFDNFRKRTEKEKASMYVIGAKDIVEKILPVLDSFERGLAQAADRPDDPFAEGMQMIYKQLMTALEELGVKPIEAVGKEFDPNLHNAVMHVDDEEAGENVVVEEFQKGYTYKDFVVRHSMVKVAN